MKKRIRVSFGQVPRVRFFSGYRSAIGQPDSEKTLHQVRLFCFGDPFQNVVRFEKAVPKTVILL